MANAILWVLSILVLAFFLLGQVFNVGGIALNMQVVEGGPPALRATGKFPDLDPDFNATREKANQAVEEARTEERSKNELRVWLAWGAILLTVILGILGAMLSGGGTSVKVTIAIVGVLATGLQAADKLLEKEASDLRARHLRIHDAITKAVLKYTSAKEREEAYQAQRELDLEMGK